MRAPITGIALTSNAPITGIGGGRRANARTGFTMAEAAITIAIVGLTLSYTMQALQSAQITAGHSRNVKVARELAMSTLGDISTGLWWDDILTERSGSYADMDYPEYSFELSVGDESFPDIGDRYYDPDHHDSYLWREEQALNSGEEIDEEAAQAFEKLQVRVTFPQLNEDLENQITLERWIPWEQVYGPDEDLDEDLADVLDPNSGEGGADE